MKERVYGIDFVRVIAALGIVLHHYSRELSYSGSNTRYFLVVIMPRVILGGFLLLGF